MNIRKQLKVGKKMKGFTTSIAPRKLKGLKMAKRIKAVKKINVAKRLRRISFTKSTSRGDGGGAPIGIPRSSTSRKWFAIVRKKILSSRPKFRHYYANYNAKGRNSSTTTGTNKNNMIIIHNNTSIAGNEELDNWTSCVDEAKDLTPLQMKQDDVTSIGSATPLPAGCQASKEDQEQDIEIIRLREEKAAIHIQSVFRGHLARRACRAFKSLVRLQAMVRGVCVRRQARIALDCVNALVRLQFRVRTRQLLLDSPSNDPIVHPSSLD